MSTTTDEPKKDDTTTPPPKDDDKKTSKCPINETWRHVLYIGGMVAMHAGMGATASVAHKSSKCPLSEWGRHIVYTGGLVALVAMTWGGGSFCSGKPKLDEKPAAAPAASSEPQKWYQVCPLDEWGKHAVYVAGVVGLVALVNARKK